MSSQAVVGDDSSKRRSVVVVDMPEELINRETLKTHFEQFGTVERLACSVSKKYAVIHFSTSEEAVNAAQNGTKIRPDLPPLKIYNRAITTVAPKASEPAPVPHSSGSRVVTTRRKIVRTFNSDGSTAITTSFVNEPASGAEKSTLLSAVDVIDNISKSESGRGPPPSPPPYPGGPLRAAVKISRPSPFFKRKPSFGDKLAKPGASLGSRNPFSLPPRSKLSVDRRKISPKTETDAKPGMKSQANRRSSAAESGANLFQDVPRESSYGSSEIILPDTDENNDPEPENSSSTENPVQQSTSADNLSASDSALAEGEPSSTLDIDETTEDAILNDDAAEQDNVFATGGTDTQDTAEVSTEEEGEIQDDEDEENQEEEGNQSGENEDVEDDDVYESPLKRAEGKASSTDVSNSSPFSFKLSSTKPSDSGGGSATASSLFKLPFTSPFALGDAPKPFSSTTFGVQFDSSKMTKIFAGGSTTSSSLSSKSEEKTNEPTQEQVKLVTTSTFSFASPTLKPEAEKPKASPFGLFSSLSSSSALPKSSSITGLSSGTANKEMKQAVFTLPKPIVAPSSIGTGSSSIGFSSTLHNVLPKKSVLGSGSTTSTIPIQAQSQSQRDTPNPLLLTFTADTVEAQELLSKRSNTVEERYRILEARDKLIRSRVPKTKVNVEHASRLIGTCPDMCPEKERYMRQFQRQLVPYEMLPGQDHVVDHQKAIKVYSRSSADQEEPLPHELRPGPTLDFTMHYLLRFIVPLGDNPDENLSDWYNFLWDRTRSIRKDITQQQIIDLTAVSLYEKCTRFHIHCASRLCELDVHSFDPKLNDENLMKCLQSLEHLYEDLRRRQVTCPNEPEFRAYQIMMNLNEGDALYNAQQLPSWILNSHEVQIALKLHHSIYTKNFVAFFKTVESLPYMTSCILHRYFFQVRSLALRCFIKAHCTLPKYETAMPISTLQRMLGYGTAIQSFCYLCEAHGIHCDVEDNKIFLKRKLFYLPEFPSIYRETYLIDSKLKTSVAEAINGVPLPDIDFSKHQPHSSFNENGQLIPGDIIGSQDRRPASFVPSAPVPSSGVFSKPTSQMHAPPLLAASGGFTFSSVFSQPKKEPVQPIIKPFRQIESVCESATAKLIDESVKKDVERLSQARLEEAKRVQEQETKKKLRMQIATRLVAEYIDKAISQHVDAVVRVQSEKSIRQQRIVNEVAESSVEILVDECVQTNLGISARTELILAKEYHHRLIRMLERIFQRLRARFALERWLRYTRTKIQEREKEEEKRREELWNFPAINTYGMTMKDVYRAFCGNSPVQPSIFKIETLSASPENFLQVRASKRKSDGDTEGGCVGSKYPRVISDIESNQEVPYKTQQMWDFPPVNPYSRTNRQVLEALCGKNTVANLPVLPVQSPGGKRKGDDSLSFSGSSPFKIHRPGDGGRGDLGRGLGEEIRHKVNESNLDLLKDIQEFMTKINEEKEQSKSLEPFLEGVENVKKNCPELNASSQSVAQLQEESDDDDMYDEQPVNFNHPLSGVFIEEGNLLNQLQRFVREVKEEKAKSWKTDTFLNDIDINLDS